MATLPNFKKVHSMLESELATIYHSLIILKNGKTKFRVALRK
jgi:hypothetical protein